MVKKNVSNYKWVDELVTIVPHDPTWITKFESESVVLRKIFEPHRLVGLEHYGSTAVPGLYAKPIIDILIGLNEFSLAEKEKERLQLLGYEYIGRALSYERFFLRKRGQGDFNLAIVRYAGTVWRDSIVVRDYLRTHPEKAEEYALLKHQALAEGYVTIPVYADYKRDFVVRLSQEAQEWWNQPRSS